MHSLVIYVGASTLCDVETIVIGLGRVSEVLLLVTDVVLCASHDASCLDTLDGWHDEGACEVWVWREAFLEGSQKMPVTVIHFDIPNSCHLQAHDQEDRKLDRVARPLPCLGALVP